MAAPDHGSHGGKRNARKATESGQCRISAAQTEVTLDQIQAAIPADAVLVDFLQFSRSRPAEKKGHWDYTPSLLAVIVKQKGDPQLIELGAVNPLGESIDTWRQTFGCRPRENRRD